MKITTIVVGRAGAPLKDAILEYETRAGRYWKFNVIEVTSEARLLARLPERAQIVALTRTGQGMSSTDLAAYLQEHALHSTPEVCFLIGGAFGLGPDILERAQKRWSLSDATLPHEMARLVLAEQLYRAGTIVRNEPYHKGPTSSGRKLRRSAKSNRA
jgi:23S rRNA (pseudouridine1915-N3)-methyltransferase